MNLYQKGNGESKGKGNERDTEPNTTESNPASISNQGGPVEGAVVVSSKSAESG